MAVATVAAIGAAVAAAFASTTPLIAIGGVTLLSVGGALSAAAGIALSVGANFLFAPDIKTPSSSVSNTVQTSVRQPVSPRRIIYGETRVGGTFTLVDQGSQGKDYINLVITLSGHEISIVDKLYFTGQEVPFSGGLVTTGDYANHVRIRYRTGDELNLTPPADMLFNLPGVWSGEHVQRGCAWVWLQLKANRNIFDSGIPDITFLVRGKNNIYDPRDGLYKFTKNAALIVADYLATPKPLGPGFLYGTEIDLDSLIEAANICDETVAKADGGTEKRYEINGSFENTNVAEVLPDLLAAMAGKVVLQGSKLHIRAGAYRVPEISLDENDFIGPVNVTTLRSIRELYNGVRGTFLNPKDNYQPTDFPVVKVDDYVTADGEELFSTVNFNFTDSVTTIQRICRIFIEQARRQIKLEGLVADKLYQAQVGDTINVTLQQYGWVNKVFEIEQLTFNADEAISINVSLRETDPNVYSWDVADEKPLPAAPKTKLPDPFDVLPPSVSVTDRVVTVSPTVTAGELVVTLTPPSSGLVSRYEVQYKRSIDAEYTSLGQSVSAVFRLPNAETNVEYNIRARAINALGAESEWTTVDYIIIGELGPPDDVTDFEVSIIDRYATLSWEPVANSDLDYYVVRFNPNLYGVTWDNSQILVRRVAKPASTVTLGALNGTYLIKAVDFNGNESVNASLITNNNQGDTRFFTTVAESVQHPSFSGTKSATVETATVGGSTVLRLKEKLDGTIEATGTYDFSSAIDVGTVYAVKISGSFSAYGENIYADDIFSYSNMFALDNIFTSDSNKWRVRIQIATSTDNIAFSDWRDLFAGDYVARSFKFRAVLDSLETDAIRPVVTTLSVQLQVPDRTIAANNITVPSSGSTVTFNKPFRELSGVAISGNNLQNGDYYVITAQDSAGFSITWYNSSSVAVERSMNYVAHGHGETTS